MISRAVQALKEIQIHPPLLLAGGIERRRLLGCHSDGEPWMTPSAGRDQTP
jgi:hypothetical protein